MRLPRKPDEEVFLDVVMDGARKAEMPCLLVVFGKIGGVGVASSRHMDRVSFEDTWKGVGRLIARVANPGEDVEDMVRLIREGAREAA